MTDKEIKFGRPPLYNKPKEMQADIEAYFNDGVTIKKVEVGPKDNKQVIEIPVPTITGLCLYLGFESRQSFYDYEKKSDFTYTIKRARLFIEKHYEEMLQTNNVTGAIFALKNFQWRDKQEVGFTDAEGKDISLAERLIRTQSMDGDAINSLLKGSEVKE